MSKKNPTNSEILAAIEKLQASVNEAKKDIIQELRGGFYDTNSFVRAWYEKWDVNGSKRIDVEGRAAEIAVEMKLQGNFRLYDDEGKSTFQTDFPSPSQ